MSGLIKGVHHIALKCHGMEEFEKTIGFYRDVLGMEVVRTWGEDEESGAMLSTGNSLMEIFVNAESDLPQGAIRHFALANERNT